MPTFLVPTLLPGAVLFGLAYAAIRYGAQGDDGDRARYRARYRVLVTGVFGFLVLDAVALVWVTFGHRLGGG